MDIKSIFLRLRAVHWIGILLLVLNATFLTSDLLAKIVQYVVAFVVFIHDIDEKKWAVDPLDELTKFLQKNDFSQKIAINSAFNSEVTRMVEALEHYRVTINEKKIQDQKVITETMQVIEDVARGNFDTSVKQSGASEEINILKNSINKLIEINKTNFQNIINALESFSNLDFSHTIHKDQKIGGYILKVIENLEKSGKNISQLTTEINQDSEQLLKITQQLNEIIAELEHNAKEQTKTVAQSVQSIDTASKNINTNTQNALQMAKYASDVTSSANNGRELANQTVASMEEIDTKVGTINQAIVIIDQIAFQTNILSLNAAVEAATAGEAGKGFAVVAQEVRNLATRSAEAAKEIKILVEGATSKANEGKGIATDMISGYSQLTNNITNTIIIINEVSNTSKEQQNTISLIHNNMLEIEKITHRAKSISDEIGGISKNAIALSDNLKHTIGKIQL